MASASAAGLNADRRELPGHAVEGDNSSDLAVAARGELRRYLEDHSAAISLAIVEVAAKVGSAV
jgi:hypothetical protein